MIDIAASSEEFSDIGTGVSSPYATLISLTLVIAALLLTSYSLFFYANKESNTSGLPAIQLASILETIKKPMTMITTPKAKASATETAKNETTEKQEVAKKSTEDTVKTEKVMGIFTRKARWPALTITGYGTASRSGDGFAIINGQQVMVNGTINDVKLIEIRSQDVVVEFNGERKNIAIDN